MNTLEENNPLLQQDARQKLVTRSGTFGNSVSQVAHFLSVVGKPPLPFYDDLIDSYMQPMYLGELGLVLARTSNGKSWLLRYWAKRHGRNLSENYPPDFYTIYVALEDTIESLALGAFYEKFPDVNIFDLEVVNKLLNEFILQNSTMIGDRMVYSDDRVLYIAPSMMNPQYNEHLTAANVLGLINWLQENPMYKIDGEFKPLKISGVFFDYLQSTSHEPSGQAHKEESWEKVERETNELFKGAKTLKTQIIVAAQALDELKACKEWYVPNEYEIQKTRYTGTRVALILSIALAVKTFTRGTRVTVSGNSRDIAYDVADGIMKIRLVKRRPNYTPDAVSGVNFLGKMNFMTGDFDRIELFEVSAPKTIHELHNERVRAAENKNRGVTVPPEFKSLVIDHPTTEDLLREKENVGSTAVEEWGDFI